MVEKDSAILDHDNEQSIPLNANHREMCRFSEECNNYKIVSDMLLEIVEDLENNCR